jgi:glycosyltransferase involved in cell wall biosynthesis
MERDEMRGLRAATAGLARHGLGAGYRVLHATGLYRCPAVPVAFITEGANWTIKWVGQSYVDGIEARYPGTMMLTDRPYALFDRVLHFGSQFFWQLWSGAVPPSNRCVVSFFHGKPEDSPEMARHIDFFLANHPRLARVVTAASPIERRLLEWGVPREKLVRIPLGVDTTAFRPAGAGERAAIRTRLGIPDDAVCIGSFQKDGVGWGEGNEPKLIKGPDLFVEAARRLAADFPVFVLLTGPARGYVKNGLARHGIPFHHVYHEDYGAVAECYRALDLYLMTSREEGGPQCLLESMASGVPLVSTRTGIAEDVIEDGQNGALLALDDFEGLVLRSAEFLAGHDRAEAVRAHGMETAASHDWRVVAPRLYEEVYKKLLD